jgi:TRAP-type C4-dicarboxylate transport system permease small subunit
MTEEVERVQKILRATFKISKTTNSIGGMILVLMMLLTVVDVILRYLGRPITGTYELMSFAGALVVGFAIAQASLERAHVNVDLITHALPPRQRNILLVLTKCVGIGIFALLAWALFLKGNDLYTTHEVSLTLHVPYYPVAYGLSLGSLVECLALLSDILKTVLRGGGHE